MIRFENVHKTYKTGTDALRGVTFAIRDGEFVFVIGKSGSGKSTLMKCITREEKPTEGLVIIDKFCISKMPRALVPILRRQIGIIYQDFRLIETKTVEENIAFAGEIIGVPRKKLHQMVDIVLGAVGLRDKANSMPMELSGGEQQRVAIARAMLNNPKLIVADEPTDNLDPETSESIMALLNEINRNGTTVIVCTHDSNLVDRMKKRVIEVDEGLIVRDEKGSGYTAEEKHSLPQSMIDEFVPEVVSYHEIEKKEEKLPEFPSEEKEALPEFPSEEKEETPKITKLPTKEMAEERIVVVPDRKKEEKLPQPKDEKKEETLPQPPMEEQKSSVTSDEKPETAAAPEEKKEELKEEVKEEKNDAPKDEKPSQEPPKKKKKDLPKIKPEEMEDPDL
ncbi:MAG: cell division ATP-binding protein FtsE [Clostridiales bacterium]|nr:cell division ATP-binding protein FtsE [Clostridiales bacterium]